MSGIHEKEIKFELKILNRLKGEPQIITEYYHCLINCGKSYSTAYSYISCLLSFVKYTFGDKYDDDFYTKVSQIHIDRFIGSLRNKMVNGKIEKTSDGLKALAWSSLKSFFDFLVPKYIEKNPVDGIERPKIEKNVDTTYLEPQEISKMISNVEQQANKRMKNRDLCLLKLGFSTGLRASELLQIDIGDIDLDKNRIKITEKSGNDYYVMFGERLKMQLLLWLQDRKDYFGQCSTNALFVSQMGKRMSTDMLAKLMTKYAKGATEKHVTPHVMRHSCATNLYEKTGDLLLCAKQLNHKHLSNTQRYAEISKNKQNEAVSILDEIIV